MRDWLARLGELLAHGPVALVKVLSAEGSTPREVGAKMLVTRDTIEGTIGGGALEFQAIADARSMLADARPWQRRTIEVPLGPAVQQCCGGFVRLLLEAVTADQQTMIASVAGNEGLLIRPAESGKPWIIAHHRKDVHALPLPVAKLVRDMLSGAQACETVVIEVADTPWLVEPIRQTETPLYLYGAGHVAREVVAVLHGLPFAIHWIDVAPNRFPATVDPSVRLTATEDPVSIARRAPAEAIHVVMTFSHALDEAITASLLEANTFAYLGLIGSKTKRARFVQRFRRAGIRDDAIARLTCPIGLASVPGKTPRTIAIALAAELVAREAARHATVASGTSRE